jgi:hypothetical protein
MDWEKTKELGMRVWVGKEETGKGRRELLFFSLLPLPPIEEADLQPWFGEGVA